VFDDLSWVNYVSDPDEWCVILRTEKIWRVLFPTRPENVEDEAYLLSDEFIQQRLHHLWDKEGAYDIGHRPQRSNFCSLCKDCSAKPTHGKHAVSKLWIIGINRM